VDAGESIERALANIVLTRGEGKVNEARFAGAVLRGAPVPDAYLIENYRHLALTEQAGIRTAACEVLWISLFDPQLSGIAQEGMQQADCHCRTKERGEPDCGPKGYTHDDPPF
jgi:hypothetical protein